MLETESLILRVFTEADADLLYDLHANPEVAKGTIDGLQSREKINKHLEDFISHQNKFGYSQFAVFEKESNEFIGRAGLTNRVLSSKIGAQDEIRFAFLPKFWGRGYADELTKFLLKFAFQTLKLDLVSASSGIHSAASFHILTKNGFKYVKNITAAGYGVTSEIKYYLITHEEFLNQK